MKVIDLSGLRFGRLEVVERVANSRNGQARWKLHCDCGGETEASSADIRAGDVQSCGCLTREIMAAVGRANFKHGQRVRDKDHVPQPRRCILPEERLTHNSWRSMRTRCSDPKHPRYARYGGRGIKVCDRWQSFDLFLEDMGLRLAGELSIDRVDNNGDYTPGNCRWSTAKEQAANRCLPTGG